jgi:hypothetical protein
MHRPMPNFSVKLPKTVTSLQLPTFPPRIQPTLDPLPFSYPFSRAHPPPPASPSRHTTHPRLLQPFLLQFTLFPLTTLTLTTASCGLPCGPSRGPSAVDSADGRVPPPACTPNACADPIIIHCQCRACSHVRCSLPGSLQGIGGAQSTIRAAPRHHKPGAAENRCSASPPRTHELY